MIYDVYFDEDISYLSQVNSLLIKKISKYLNFETQFYFSSEFYMEKGPTEKVFYQYAKNWKQTLTSLDLLEKLI